MTRVRTFASSISDGGGSSRGQAVETREGGDAKKCVGRTTHRVQRVKCVVVSEWRKRGGRGKETQQWRYDGRFHAWIHLGVHRGNKY